MSSIGYVENGADKALLDVTYIPKQAEANYKGPSKVTVKYSTLFPEFKIEVGNSNREWQYNLMITDVFQRLSCTVNLVSLGILFDPNLCKNVKVVKLLLYKKVIGKNETVEFLDFTTKKENVSLIDQTLKFNCKFKIANSNTTYKNSEIFFIGLKIDRFVVKFLVSDIFVGSHQKQIRRPFEIKKEIKELLSNKTFWFIHATKNMINPLPPAKKTKRSDQIGETTSDDIQETDEGRGRKRRAIEPPQVLEVPTIPLEEFFVPPLESYWNPYLNELFPLANFDIDGIPYSIDDLMDLGNADF